MGNEPPSTDWKVSVNPPAAEDTTARGITGTAEKPPRDGARVPEHVFVVVLQHWPARQSLDERHPATHALFLQMGVLPPQSELSQHAPVAQLPLQHFSPLPHCASLVQPQFWMPHSLVTVLQH